MQTYRVEATYKHPKECGRQPPWPKVLPLEVCGRCRQRKHSGCAATSCVCKVCDAQVIAQEKTENMIVTEEKYKATKITVKGPEGTETFFVYGGSFNIEDLKEWFGRQGEESVAKKTKKGRKTEQEQEEVAA